MTKAEAYCGAAVVVFSSTTGSSPRSPRVLYQVQVQFEKRVQAAVGEIIVYRFLQERRTSSGSAIRDVRGPSMSTTTWLQIDSKTSDMQRDAV
jgi:hypothetical protein